MAENNHRTGGKPIRASRNRRSIRLRGYDYSRAGAYFVTTCAQNHECVFGDIENNAMRLNGAGDIVVDEWVKIADTRDKITLDEWVVMPNHFHGIVVFTDYIVGAIHVRAIHESPLHAPDRHQSSNEMTINQRRNMALPKLVGRFKMMSSKRINALRGTPGAKLWQRNYWEHIIRNESEFKRIREYIRNNPKQWELDKLYSSSGLKSYPKIPTSGETASNKSSDGPGWSR